MQADVQSILELIKNTFNTKKMTVAKDVVLKEKIKAAGRERANKNRGKS